MSVISKKSLDLTLILYLLSFQTVLVLTQSGPTTHYCSIKCDQGKHTVCMRKSKCGGTKGCEPIESTVEFRELMVKQHNELRNKVASGEDGSQYSNKGAKNMLAVSYDLEMEYIAQCWVNVCRTLEHDKCRNSERFHSGQNIHWGSNVNETKVAVRAWYDEIQYMTNPAWIDKFRSQGDPEGYPNDNKKRGHFTQLIWADTKYIGCARAKYGKKKLESQLICNYGPGGNMVGAPLYHMVADAAEIASECKDGKNEIYTSLCGKIDPIPTDKQWAGEGSLVADLVLINCSVLSLCLLLR